MPPLALTSHMCSDCAGDVLRAATQQPQLLQPRQRQCSPRSAGCPPSSQPGGGPASALTPSLRGTPSTAGSQRRKAAPDDGGCAERQVRPRHTGAWSPHAPDQGRPWPSRAWSPHVPDQALAPAPAAAGAVLAIGGGVLPEAAQMNSRVAASTEFPCGSECTPVPVGRGRGNQPGFLSGFCSPHGGAVRTASAAKVVPAPGLRYGLRCDVPGARPMSAEAANAVSPPCSHPVPQEGAASAPASPSRGAGSVNSPVTGSATPGHEECGAGPACGNGGAAGGGDAGGGVSKLGSGLARAAPAPLPCTSPGRAAGAAAAHRAIALKRLASIGRAHPNPAPAACAGLGPVAVKAPRVHEPGRAALWEAPSSVPMRRLDAPREAHSLVAAPILHTARPTVPAPVASGMPGHAAARAAARNQRVQASPETLQDPAAGPHAAPDGRGRDAAAHRGGNTSARARQRAPDPSPSPTLTPPPPKSAVKRGLARLLGLSPMQRSCGRELPSACASVSQAGPLAKGARPLAVSPQSPRTAAPEAGPLATGRAGWGAGWQAAGVSREPKTAKGFVGMGGGRWRLRDDTRADGRR